MGQLWDTSKPSRNVFICWERLSNKGWKWKKCRSPSMGDWCPGWVAEQCVWKSELIYNFSHFLPSWRSVLQPCLTFVPSVCALLFHLLNDNAENIKIQINLGTLAIKLLIVRRPLPRLNFAFIQVSLFVLISFTTSNHWTLFFFVCYILGKKRNFCHVHICVVTNQVQEDSLMILIINLLNRCGQNIHSQ